MFICKWHHMVLLASEPLASITPQPPAGEEHRLLHGCVNLQVACIWFCLPQSCLHPSHRSLLQCKSTGYYPVVFSVFACKWRAYGFSRLRAVLAPIRSQPPAVSEACGSPQQISSMKPEPTGQMPGLLLSCKSCSEHHA
eukprot:1152626-Pelagomonas_calceolata.AAC.4